jgi:hypothetical protein
MAAWLSALRTGRALLTRNIILSASGFSQNIYGIEMYFEQTLHKK